MRASRAAVVRFFPLARSAFHTLDFELLLACSDRLLVLRQVEQGAARSEVLLEAGALHASMPGWSAQEARKGGHLLDWEHLPMKSECVHTKALTPAQGEPQFSES